MTIRNEILSVIDHNPQTAFDITLQIEACTGSVRKELMNLFRAGVIQRKRDVTIYHAPMVYWI